MKDVVMISLHLFLFYKNISYVKSIPYILIETRKYKTVVYNMKKIVKYYWPMFLGMLFCFVVIEVQKSTKALLKPSVISDMVHQIMKNGQPEREYLLHIIKLRGSQLLFIITMKMMNKGHLGNFIWLFIIGSGIGIGGYYLVSAYNLFGLILLVVFLFPQYIFYFMAYYKSCEIDYISQQNDLNRAMKKGYIVQKILAILVVIIGVLSEFYVNPIFIKFFEKIIYIKNYKM